MRKAEMEIEDRDEVSVTMSFEHRGEKEICKKFIFEKDVNGDIRTRDFSFVGYEIVGSERYRYFIAIFNFHFGFAHFGYIAFAFIIPTCIK